MCDSRIRTWNCGRISLMSYLCYLISHSTPTLHSNPLPTVQYIHPSSLPFPFPHFTIPLISSSFILPASYYLFFLILSSSNSFFNTSSNSLILAFSLPLTSHFPLFSHPLFLSSYSLFTFFCLPPVFSFTHSLFLSFSFILILSFRSYSLFLSSHSLFLSFSFTLFL